MRVLIGCNIRKEGSAELAAELAALLRKSGFTLCVYGKDSEYADVIGADIIETPNICDFAVTVGGDGTILKWGKIAAEYDIPLLGVNMGRLGFMATLEPHEISRIPELLSGEFSVSRRIMLECKVFREEREIQRFKAPRIRGQLRRRGGFESARGRYHFQHTHGFDGVFAVSGRTYPVAGPGVYRVHGALSAHAVQSPDAVFGQADNHRAGQSLPEFKGDVQR